MPELTGVSTSELYSWRSGIVLIRAMASRLDDNSPPPQVAAWLNDRESVVTAEIERRR
ncbi:MAG TPA: hypothetical protein VGG16_17095 [Streptosporangiaceae bacterium]